MYSLCDLYQLHMKLLRGPSLGHRVILEDDKRRAR